MLLRERVAGSTVGATASGSVHDATLNSPKRREAGAAVTAAAAVANAVAPLPERSPLNSSTGVPTASGSVSKGSRSTGPRNSTDDDGYIMKDRPQAQSSPANAAEDVRTPASDSFLELEQEVEREVSELAKAMPRR